MALPYIIGSTVFSILGLFTIIYLEAIQPTLVKERSNNHKIVINNTKDNIERLNIEYTKEGIRDFLLSTRFLFQSLDRVQFYDLSGNLIGDTNILDLDQSVFTGSDIIFEETLGSETIKPDIEATALNVLFIKALPENHLSSPNSISLNLNNWIGFSTFSNPHISVA